MHRTTLTAVILLLPFSLLAGSSRADNWPAWRGPHGTGHVDETKFPLEWSADKNVAWKVALPGPGNSTPIVWENKLLVTCASPDGRKRSLLCFDRREGKQLWERSVDYPQPERTHRTNPQCSSSPVTDGKHVLAWHGSAGLFCYDLDGKEIWSRQLGTFEHIWGTGSSPAIHNDQVILNCGPGLKAFVVALQIATGEEIWRKEFPEMVSEKADEYRGSWSTPVFYQADGRDVMLMSLPMRLYALDPSNGKELWSCGGLSKLVYTSPLVHDDAVVAMSGFHGPAIAVRRGGSGDVTESHRLWHHTQRKQIPQRVGSGVIAGDHIYILNESGVAWCLDLKTGEQQWEQRLPGKSWSSMCLVGERIYALNMDGLTYVLEVNPTACKVLARNALQELTRGSPAFSNGEIFIRTYEHLYCIREE